MNPYTLVIFTMLVLGIVVQLWLLTRQAAHVRYYRQGVPLLFATQISLEAHQKSADYTIAKAHLARVSVVIEGGLLLLWTLGGGLDALDQFWRGVLTNPLMVGVAFILSVTLLMTLLELPLAWYRTFVLEVQFGFNRTTTKLFIGDMVKQMTLSLILGAPLVAAVLWIMEHAGAWWWCYAWGVWMGFGLLLNWAYPAFIAPLFNRFTLLADETLLTRVTQLVQRCGFTSDGVYVMDGSRRSGHGNAYFTGLGSHKRIVFFDTLLESLAVDEVEAVLAHELGHFHHHHVRKRWIMVGFSSLAGLGLLGWLAQQPAFYQGLGISTASSHAALLLFMLVVPLFGLFFSPLLARLSRHQEFQADDYAVAMSQPQSLVRALVRLYQDNAGTLTPDPLYSAFYDSHPPAPVRVARL